MKYLKIVIALFIISILSYISYKLFSKSKVAIGEAEYFTNFENIYPADCFINFENKKYLVQKVYKYKNKILKEYWFIGSEGFAIQKFDNILHSNLDKDLKPLEHLNYSLTNKIVKFNTRDYLISEKRNDTIISKVDDNKILLFIDE